MNAARLLALALALAACGPRVGAVLEAPSAAGLEIAIYRDAPGYAVVDDRRWIELADHTLALDHVDPRAPLSSLVVEPLAGGALRIGTCTRDALPPPAGFSPVVRCSADGAPGRFLVRVFYATPGLAASAEHELVMRAPGRATLASRYALPTPAWHTRAHVSLYDGAPGRERAPEPLATGDVTLDGSIAILAAPPRELAANLRRVYDGRVDDVTPRSPSDPAWGLLSGKAVWLWLELPGAHLPRGRVHLSLDVPGEGLHDLELPDAARAEADADTARGAPLRLRLWIDPELRGMRERTDDVGAAGDAATDLAERVTLSIANTGDTPREVTLIEHLRPARRADLQRVRASAPLTRGRDLVRAQLAVAPGHAEHVAFTVAYAF